jgi:hypothetical protein
MKAAGRLILVEYVICDPNQGCRGKNSDIAMMVRNGGRNRTEQEYRDLLAKGGFELKKTIPTQGPSILEAVPVP